MSDSFADLWASSAPAKPAQQKQKPGPAAPPHRPQYDAFSILSASQPASRAPVAGAQLTDRRARQPQQTSRGADAFSSLFASSLDGPAAGHIPDRASMTIAERAALAQNAVAPSPPAPSSVLWDGLDALARPTTPAAQGRLDLAFDSAPPSNAVPSTTVPANTASVDSDDWGLSEFSLPPQSESRSASASRSNPTLWDLDELASAKPRRPQPQPPSRSLTGTPGDFDFGNREDALLDGDDSDPEDTFGILGAPSSSGHAGHPGYDILGDLGKPVSHSHSPSPNPSTSTRAAVLPPRTGASPPPHITGQLVEMGFSPIDARAALATTMSENGFDVQAAAELLLSQASREGSARPSPNPHERERRRDGDRDRNRAARRPPQTRSDPHSHSSPSLSQTVSQPQSQSQIDITAEKLLSQASEIGRGMFSKANALWKEGKERAVKMYEEKAAVSTSGAPASDGRPRWMRDRDSPGVQDDEWLRRNETGSSNAIKGEFRDDEAQDKERQRPPARRPPQSQSQSQPPPAQPEREQEVDLFGTDAPHTTYQSPFRRGKSKTHAQPPSIPSSLSAPVLTTQKPSARSTPQRTLTFTTSIALSALTTSTSHKSTGTEAYKRGDFPAALTAYTRALSVLPPQHVLRVPILTNTALVRSKVGELRETVKDCEDAVTIVRGFVGGARGEEGDGEVSFGGSDPDFDEKPPVDVGTGKVSVTVQGGASTANGELPTSVDLVEGLTKAFRRRADALEGLEKWEAARNAWEVLLSAEWAGAGAKGDALRGAGRCRRMVAGASGGGHSTPPHPPPPPGPRRRAKPSSAPTPSSPSSSSAALAALRATHTALQSEDVARMARKDDVDARLAAWKAGREGNVRALLTSLESVLWPELGWRKVGLAEVVGKGQVKGAYVRAIAKVHPDKLNAENTTVEQRMIANGVFGALNEAWNAFQEQQ